MLVGLVAGLLIGSGSGTDGEGFGVSVGAAVGVTLGSGVGVAVGGAVGASICCCSTGGKVGSWRCVARCNNRAICSMAAEVVLPRCRNGNDVGGC